jgi:hypothetical protein
MNEHDLHLAGTLYFFNRGWRVFNEVNWHGCYLCDQILMRGERLVTIEYKLRDYKRAAYQSYLNGTLTDSTYALMPRLVRGSKSHFRQEGIGLMVFDGDELSVIVRPRKQNVRQDTRVYYRGVCMTSIQHMLQSPTIDNPLFYWQVPERFWARITPPATEV